MWHILDIFFIIFHTSLVFFNLFGWIWRKSRKLNLITLLLTGSSWLFLGLIVGNLGYCPLTEWHFNILHRLGKSDLPDSYVKYLADRITGMTFDSTLVDIVTLYAFITAFAISLIINIRSYILRYNKS